MNELTKQQTLVFRYYVLLFLIYCVSLYILNLRVIQINSSGDNINCRAINISTHSPLEI